MLLHFDINGTIIASDSTDVGGKEYGALEYLTRSLVNPLNPSESYYDLIKRTFPKEYKDKVKTFLQVFPQHIPIFEKLLKTMETSFLFPSFVKIVENLENDTIVLRPLDWMVLL